MFHYVECWVTVGCETAPCGKAICHSKPEERGKLIGILLFAHNNVKIKVRGFVVTPQTRIVWNLPK